MIKRVPASGNQNVMASIACSHVITDSVGVPHRRAQQALHRLRITVTRTNRKRPTGLSFGLRQQPLYELPGRRPRLGPHEPARDTRHRLVQDDPPPGGVYAVAHGHATPNAEAK